MEGIHIHVFFTVKKKIKTLAETASQSFLNFQGKIVAQHKELWALSQGSQEAWEITLFLRAFPRLTASPDQFHALRTRV